MENVQYLYLNSQDQLIISLNQQIKATLPLKQSYGALQRYHMKLCSDFQSLAVQQNILSQEHVTKMNDILAVISELDAKKNGYFEELRNLQNQKAKVILDKKNFTSASETLANKFNLEIEHSRLLQQRKRQILENINKTDQSINAYRKIISGIQDQIKAKINSVKKIEQNIQERTQVNCMIAKQIEEKQNKIKSVESKNEKIILEVRKLDDHLYHLQIKVKDALKKSKELNEIIFAKKAQILNLNNQKQYYMNLIQNEAINKNNLVISLAKLNSVLENLLKELDKLSKENSEYEFNIKMLKDNYEQSVAKLSSLKIYLTQLVKTNSVLIEVMKKSCREDQKVHQILDYKVDRLNKVMIETDYEKKNTRTIVLRDKSNQLFFKRTGLKSGNAWINQFADLEYHC